MDFGTHFQATAIVLGAFPTHYNIGTVSCPATARPKAFLPARPSCWVLFGCTLERVSCVPETGGANHRREDTNLSRKKPRWNRVHNESLPSPRMFEAVAVFRNSPGTTAQKWGGRLTLHSLEEVTVTWCRASMRKGAIQCDPPLTIVRAERYFSVRGNPDI